MGGDGFANFCCCWCYRYCPRRPLPAVAAFLLLSFSPSLSLLLPLLPWTDIQPSDFCAQGAVGNCQTTGVLHWRGAGTPLEVRGEKYLHHL